MPAYIVALIEVTDPTRYAEYVKATPAAIARFGGRFLARAGRTETLEGPEEKRRVIIIEFPSLDQAKAFYDSAEYQQVRELRRDAAIGTLILIEGSAPLPTA